MSTIYWPTILRPQKIKIDLAHRSLRGPSAQSGFTQVISNSAGIWTGTYDSIPVYSSSMIRCWRALDTLIEGQLGVISLPAWDFPRSPSAMDELGSNIQSLGPVPNSDGSFFNDYSGYAGTWTNVTVTSKANIGDTTITLTKNAPKVTLELGHRFSVNSRLYQIKSITAQNDSTATIVIRPPIREAVFSGDIAEFDYPRVLMRLTDDKAMNLDLNYNANCFPTLTFIEAV